MARVRYLITLVTSLVNSIINVDVFGICQDAFGGQFFDNSLGHRTVLKILVTQLAQIPAWDGLVFQKFAKKSSIKEMNTDIANPVPHLTENFAQVSQK